MKGTKIVIITAMGMAMAGCGSLHNSNKAYVAGGKTAPALVSPSGIQTFKQQSYYMVPNLQDNGNSPVSLAPPDSGIKDYVNLNRADARMAAKQNANANANASTTPAAPTSIAESGPKAWQDVGRALKRTPFKILDQDSSLQSYYVLDVPSTNNRVTEQTPIYRVQVRSSGSGAQMVVTNQQNEPVDAAVSQRIVSAIQRNLAKSG